MTDAVILAAGKAVRCHPLTLTRPKPLLEVAGIPLIEHTLASLPKEVRRVVIVLGHRGDALRQHLGQRFGSIALEYVEQKEQLGTADALACAEGHVRGNFLALNGDDIYDPQDLRSLLTEKRALLVREHEHPERFGVAALKGNRVVSLDEKPEKPKSRLVSIGAYLFSEDIFPLLRAAKRSPRGEYELPAAISAYCRTHEVRAVRAKGRWLPIAYPWDILDANAAVLDGMPGRIEGTVEKGATVKGKLILGKGSVVRAGTTIEGPVRIGKDCVIGPNAYLRDHVTLGDGCKAGASVELKNTVLFSGAKVPHLSYIGDSVIGSNANLGAGTITANLRHDGAGVKSSVCGVLVDSGRRKLGAIIGDNVHTGINTSIYPGRKIWPGKTTLPGEVVRKDVES